MPAPGLDRAGYLEAVVSRHVAAFEEEIDPLLAELGADREEALEELYDLVCDVRPDLEIGAVRLPAEPAPETRRADPREEARRTLRRLARDARRRLAERVIGQDAALDVVARLVRRAASGLARRGPRASLLLVGPTGTGKTELGRSLAHVLGSSFELLRVDCSELAAGHEYSRLIGAPPGYVGHEEGGSLTERIRRHPDAVVLFDEVEKAHPSLHRLLLQLLDEARLTDGRAQTADFSRAFVVMTSNCGTHELERAHDGLGFARSGIGEEIEDTITRRALGEAFAPEFLARLDAVLSFRELSLEDTTRVAALKLAELARDVRAGGARLSWTPAVARWIARETRGERGGGRALERVLERAIEPAIVDALLDPERRGRGWLRLGVRGGRPSVRRETD